MKNKAILIILNLAIIAAGVAVAVAIMSMGNQADKSPDENLITLFNENGETKEVPYDTAAEYEQYGWYTFEPVFLYDATGKKTPVAKEVVDELIRNGWTQTPPEQSKNYKGSDISAQENEAICDICGSVNHLSSEHPNIFSAE